MKTDNVEEVKVESRVHPEGYLPYVTDVTEEIWKQAAEELNETPERRAQCLKELRERLSKETDLDSRTDEPFLLNILRARKFDVDRAMNMIKRYYSFLESHRDIFCQDNTASVKRFQECDIITYLPYRDKNNSAIFVVKAAAYDVNAFPPDDVIYGGLVNLRTSIEMPVNQITGFVAIVDLKNVSLWKLLPLAPKYAMFAAEGLQYCCPGKVKAIHVLNLGEIYRLGWKIVKPLISEKIRRRIIFHKGDCYESLHQYIPKSLLPAELGGDLGTVNNAHWLKSTEKLLVDYNEDLSHGYKNFDKKKSYFNWNPAGPTLEQCLNRLKKLEVFS